MAFAQAITWYFSLHLFGSAERVKNVSDLVDYVAHSYFSTLTDVNLLGSTYTHVEKRSHDSCPAGNLLPGGGLGSWKLLANYFIQ